MEWDASSSWRPETKAFTCGKWNIGSNFGIDNGAESKFGTHKELIVLNILKYKHCVNKSRDMSRDHFAKKSYIIDQLVAGWRKEIEIKNIFLIHIKYFKHFTFGMTVHCTSIDLCHVAAILSQEI